MIKEIVDQWEANKHKLEKWFRKTKLKEYDSYLKIVSAIFTYVISEYDVKNIHVINDGDWSGTEIFIIPEKDVYQPGIEDYLMTHTYYSSCSGCDTLLNIIDFYEEDYPNEEQVKQLMTLSLHLIQRMKPLCEQ